MNTNRHLTSFLIFDTHQLEIDEPQNPKVSHIFKDKVGEGNSLLFRSVIGVINMNILALIYMEGKRWGIAKIG